MKLRNTILFKITISLILSTVLVLSLYGYYSYYNRRAELKKSKAEKLELILNRTSNNILEPLWTIDHLNALKILSFEISDLDVSAIVVTFENGDLFTGVISSTDSSTIKILPGRHYKTLEDPLLKKLEKVVYRQGVNIGNVIIYYTENAVDAQLASLITSTIRQTVFVSLMIVLVLFFMLRKIVVQPLNELNRQINDITRGNYSTNLKIRSADEIGSLMESFNNMISELNRRNLAMTNSESKYRSLFECANDAIFLIKEKKVIECNNKTTSLFGLSKEEIIGKEPLWLAAMPVEKPGELCQGNELMWNKALEGKPQYFVCGYKDKNGNPFYLEVNMHSIAQQGEVFLQAIARDITERKISEKKIHDSLAEKEILLKEIHHRVKNNLQIVSSLLNLQALSITDQPTLELFRVSQDRVHSMALIHERLYQSNDLAQINFGEYVRNLTANLFRSYQIGQEKIILSQNIPEEISLGLDTAIPLGLILNEVITNALKYGFAGHAEGEITVDFNRQEDNYCLKIANTGELITDDQKVSTGRTLGLQLVNILTNQLKGTLVINNETFTEFVISFPVRKK